MQQVSTQSQLIGGYRSRAFVQAFPDLSHLLLWSAYVEVLISRVGGILLLR